MERCADGHFHLKPELPVRVDRPYGGANVDVGPFRGATENGAGIVER